MKLTLSAIAMLGLVLLGIVGYNLIHSELLPDSPRPPEATKAAAMELVTVESPKPHATSANPFVDSGQLPPISSYLPDYATIQDPTSPALKAAYPLVQQGHLDDALAILNSGIQATPGDPMLYNARAFIYTQQQHLDLAKQDLLKCLDLGDKTPLTKFDLTEIDFVEKNYDAARPGFLALENDTERGDLSSFKVFLCDLLGGHEDQAAKDLSYLSDKGTHASYYFANVAWSVYHEKPDEARKWLESAQRIYSPQKLNLYSYSLTKLGYLPLPPQPMPESTTTPAPAATP